MLLSTTERRPYDFYNSDGNVCHNEFLTEARLLFFLYILLLFLFLDS